MLNTPGTPASSAPGTSSTTTTNSPAGAQHRLMLKQTPIDVWSLREQLGLASAVLRSGDQNWVSVSRQMKPFSEEGRPQDWFSQKNCALQYNLLLEKVDTPRRKRGDKMETVETPGEAIVRRLTAERIKELKKVIEQQANQMKKLEEEVQLLNDPATSEDKIDEIEREIEMEDQEEVEKQLAHTAWLAEREEKKKAIQAALKAHSAKIPLKGAAATAVAQASIARRLSIQSDQNSFSEVDSPVSQTTTEATTKPEPTATVTTGETSSPLLSSLLKSPTAAAPTVNSVTTIVEEPTTIVAEPQEEIKEVPEPAVIANGKDSFEEPVAMEIEEKVSIETAAAEEVVNNVEEQTPPSVEAEPLVVPEKLTIDQDNNVTLSNSVVTVEPVADEKANEEPAEESIEKPAKETDVITKPDTTAAVAVVGDVQIKIENEESEPEVSFPVPVEEQNGKELPEEIVEIKTEPEPIKNDPPPVEEVIKVKPLEEVKEEIVELISSPVKQVDIDPDSKTPLSEKRSKKPGRRRKQSDLPEDENINNDDTPAARRETRSKKTSERSEETSAGGGVGTPSQEVGSEESPVATPSQGQLAAIRETRRSAAKKAQVPSSSDATEDLESSKEEKEENLSVQAALENRRISRLKDKETGQSKGRRGSGTTTTSRSSSPVPSGDESESDLLLPRLTRTRRKSGRPATTSVATTATPPLSETPMTNSTEDISPPESPISVNNPQPIVLEREPEEEWVKSALSLLSDVRNHKIFCKLNEEFKTNDQVVRRHSDLATMKKGLEEGSIKSVHDFNTEFMLMLVNFVMSNSSKPELLNYVQSLYNEFNDLIQELIMPYDVSKSTPLKSTQQQNTNSKPKKSDDAPLENSNKKTRGDKRDAAGQVILPGEDRRKRGSTSTSIPSEESSSTPATPNTKKRKRIC